MENNYITREQVEQVREYIFNREGMEFILMKRKKLDILYEDKFLLDKTKDKKRIVIMNKEDLNINNEYKSLQTLSQNASSFEEIIDYTDIIFLSAETSHSPKSLEPAATTVPSDFRPTVLEE